MRPIPWSASHAERPFDPSASRTACGAPLGGYISDNFGWRIAFLCQSPLLLFGVFIIFIKCQEPKSFLDSPTSGWEKVKRIDYLGSITLVGGIGTLLLASVSISDSHVSKGRADSSASCRNCSMSLKTTSRLAWSDPTIYGLLIARSVPYSFSNHPGTDFEHA